MNRLRDFKRQHRNEIWVGTASFVAALVWSVAAGFKPQSDFLAFYAAAGNVARGLGYQLNGMDTAYWSPGYPFLLVPVFRLFGQSVGVVYAVNSLLHGASAVFVYLLARRLVSSRSALVVGLGAAVLPDKLYFTGHAAAENLAAPLLLGLLLAWFSWWDAPARRLQLAAIAGALLGLLTLTRPVAQLLPLVIAPAMALADRSRRGLSSAGVLLLLFAVVLSPWLVRNTLVLGAPVITTNGGASLLLAYNPIATGEYDPRGLLPAVEVNKPSDELTADRVYRARSIEFMRTHVGELPRIAANNAYALFFTRGATDQLQAFLGGASASQGVSRIGRSGVAGAILLGVLAPLYRIALVVLSFGFAAIALRHGQREWLLPAAIIAYYLLTHSLLGIGSPRYTVPIQPLMLVMSAGATLYIAGRLVQSPRRRAVAEAGRR